MHKKQYLIVMLISFSLMANQVEHFSLGIWILTFVKYLWTPFIKKNLLSVLSKMGH